jgi:hypothetical protein
MFCTIALLASASLLSSANAWKVKIGSVLSDTDKCSITENYADTPNAPFAVGIEGKPIVLASFSQKPTTCTVANAGDALGASVFVEGTDNGALTVRVLNTCNSDGVVTKTTVCGQTTLVAGISAATPADVLQSCGGAGKCLHQSAGYCQSYACFGSPCGVALQLAQMSFDGVLTPQTAPCAGASSLKLSATNSVTFVGTPSGAAADLSGCCANSTTSAPAATATAADTTTTTTAPAGNAEKCAELEECSDCIANAACSWCDSVRAGLDKVGAGNSSFIMGSSGSCKAGLECTVKNAKFTTCTSSASLVAVSLSAAIVALTTFF